MSGQHALKTATAQSEQTHSHAHVAHARCYTAAQIVGFLQISRCSFFTMKRRGQLPFLEELQPRLGRTVRYRADLVDRYLSGQWRSVAAHGRNLGARRTSTVSPKSGQGVS